MDIQTALDEYAWADDSIEACREALYDYSAGNDTLIDKNKERILVTLAMS